MQNNTNWTAVATVFAAGIVGAAYVGKMPTALPQLQQELGLSLVAVSWLVSIFNLIGLCAALFFGLVADRIGAFRQCLAGLVALAVGGALGSQATDSMWLLVSRVIEGAGFIALTVSAPALIAASSAPADRNLTLGLWGGYLPAGASATLAVSPVALAAIGWRGFWLAIAVATAVCAAWLAALAQRYAGVTSGRRRSLADVRQVLGQAIPWFYAIAFSAYTFSFTAVIVWLPTYLQQTRSATVTEQALLTAALVVANLCGNLYGSRLAHRDVSRGRTTMTAFLLGAMAAAGIFGSILPDAARYAAALLFNLVIGVIPPAMMSGVPRYARAPGEASSLQGLLVQFSNLGIFVAPPLVAAVVSRTGRWETSLAVLVGASTIGLLAGAAIARLEQNRLPLRASL
jgi:predicted MFS family arabinose efflux permease